MSDIAILRRSILWDFIQKDLPGIDDTFEDPGNKGPIKETMKDAFAKFIFVCGDLFDREQIESHSRALLADMREPAIYKLSDIYIDGPDIIVDEMTKEIVEAHRTNRLFAGGLKF